MGLTGCGAAYEGPYDEDFRSDLESYVGETVTISADVTEVITPASFTVTGPGDGEAQPLLVIAQHGAVVEINAGVTVDVTGLMRRGLDPQAVEEELDVELDNEELENWRSEPYIQATEIETAIDDG